MNLLKRHIEISIILFVGFVLRFSISLIHSYSNDELSAINRLQYNNFSDLLDKGVMSGDMHPAGVQVFMKGWSWMFGMNEGPMRFPFVILGVLSILLIYKIGLKWVNKQTGIYAAILLSFLYFPIMNSEFARPYSPGLFFSLLAAWYYLKILFAEEKSYKDAILLGLGFAGAMYTHHFAFMFIGWMGISGLIYANKRNLKYILIAGVLGILLYVPHIPITQFQLEVGGLQWLAPPESDWLLQFIFHALNESFLLVVAIISAVLMALVFNKRSNDKWSKMLTYFAVLFFGIFAVGFVYSYLGTPVLKFPVMLFALPFLFLILGYFLSKFLIPKVMMLVLSLMIITSTVYEKGLFGNMHYELFEEVAVDIVDWNNIYGEDNIYSVYNLNNPNYMNFYANQWDEEIDFDWDVLEFGDAAKLREDLKVRTEEYLVIGYSARLTLPQVFETCLEFYPNIVDGTKYNNASVYLLSKTDHPTIRLYQHLEASFPPIREKSNWVFNKELFVEGKIIKYPYNSYELSGDNIYGPEYHFNLNDISDHNSKYIKVEVIASVNDDAQLTASFGAKRSGVAVKNVQGEDYWEGRDLEVMLIDTERAYFTFEIPKFIEDGDDLMISFWNRNPSSPVYIHSVKVYSTGNIWN
jgi:Dolichyl-phosphate-mannose-protein mannosyltransferase